MARVCKAAFQSKRAILVAPDADDTPFGDILKCEESFEEVCGFIGIGKTCG
jgi:hypothetical protein